MTSITVLGMRLAEKAHLFYRNYGIVFPIVIALAWTCYCFLDPHFISFSSDLPSVFASRYRVPVFSLFLLLVFLLIGGSVWDSRQVFAGKEASFATSRQASVFFASLGYANVLAGVVDSFLGLLLPFVLSLLCNACRAYRKGIRPYPQSRIIVALWGAYLAYLFATSYWSIDADVSISQAQKEIWVLLIPIITLVYPFDRKVFDQWLRVALRITYLYFLLIFLIYLTACWDMDNSIVSGFAFNKFYFLTPRGYINPQFLLSPMGFNHYTYLGFMSLLPLLYAVTTTTFEKRTGWTAAGIAMLGCIDFLVLQSRMMMFLFLGVAVVAVMRTILSDKLFKKALLWGSISALGLILVGLLVMPFWVDSIRKELYRIAIYYLPQRPLWGFGAGASQSLIGRFVVERGYEHFHNQWVESMISGGVPLLLLIVASFASMFRKAWKDYNIIALVYLLLLVGILCFDLFTMLAEYLISLWTLVLLSLSASNDSAKRAPDNP